MSRTIFVAGATGAIGRRLIPILAGGGWRVIGMTRSPAKSAFLRDLGASPVVVDVFGGGSAQRAHP